MSRFKRVEEGDVISAEDYNDIAEALERFANLSVSGGHLQLWDFPDGKHLALHVPVETLALLSGATSPYSFQEVDEDASGAFSVRGVGDSGTAYEVNNVAGLGGKVVSLVWTEAGDFRFQWVGYSCSWTFTVHGCNNGALSGETVNLRQSGTLIATGTTNGSGQCVFNVPAGTYDVEVVPTESYYATYTATVTHTCSQTTGITLSPASGYVCGPTGAAACVCAPSPSSIFVTGFDPASAAVSDTCIFNSPPAGYPGTPPSNVWFGQSLHSGAAYGGTNYYLTVTCGFAGTGFDGYALHFINSSNGAVFTSYGWGSTEGSNTCHPFYFPNGHTIGLNFGGGWAITA